MTKKRPFLSAKSAKAARESALAAAPGLCMSLAGIAAFHIEDPAAQKKIYIAIKTLTALENLPPMPPTE